MKISKNFTMEEFAVSASHPELVEPVPVKYQQNIIDLVLNVLQPICDETGWNNYISSGYRSVKLNEAVDGAGSKTKGGNISQHTVGMASDNNFYQVIQGREFPITPYDVAKKVKRMELRYDQMILYPTFVHISYRKGANRNMLLYNKSYKGKRL